MKITKIVHGQGVTKNTGNYESVRVYNELEAILEKGETVTQVQEKLRAAVDQLNETDFNALLA